MFSEACGELSDKTEPIRWRGSVDRCWSRPTQPTLFHHFLPFPSSFASVVPPPPPLPPSPLPNIPHPLLHCACPLDHLFRPSRCVLLTLHNCSLAHRKSQLCPVRFLVVLHENAIDQPTKQTPFGRLPNHSTLHPRYARSFCCLLHWHPLLTTTASDMSARRTRRPRILVRSSPPHC